MSYNGIGLKTPRGSGTNGYVRRSLANIRAKPLAPYAREQAFDKPQTKTRKANPEIMEHDRKRDIEIKCLELQDKLEEEGYLLPRPHKADCRRLDEEEIEKKVQQLRQELTKQAHVPQNVKLYEALAFPFHPGLTPSRLKPHQIHDLAAAKETEMEKIRKAFGIKEDYVEGDAFKRMKDRSADATKEDTN
jgi:serine/arginine repetitive matrix protein 2